MSVEQATTALEALELSAVPVAFARMEAMITELERLAENKCAAGSAARHALEQLRQRLAR
jgi:hypothetical protein